MFKFIHIGDVHLDTTFYSKSNDIREKLRASLREAFQEVIETCIKEEVHALLIAGDLFDNNQLSFQTEQMLINSFVRLKKHNIKVYYATGNHDPGDHKLRASGIQWPDNVTEFTTDDISTVEVHDKEGRVIGKVSSVGHKTPRESRNLVKDFPCKEGDIPHVGLVHAMVTNASGVDKHDRYLPCTKEELLTKEYDYWALGHIHQRQKIGEDQNIFYSGNLQGRHPKETGEKGGLLVTVDQHLGCKVQFKPFSKITWHTLTIGGLEGIGTYNDLKNYIIDEIINYLGGDVSLPVEGIFRIELKGRSPFKKELQQDENLQKLEMDLKYHFSLLEVEVRAEELLIDLNVDDYRDGENLLSKTLELLRELEENQELMKRLMEISFVNKKFKTTGEKVAYIKSLSKGLQEEAVNRMVGEEK